MAVRVWESDLSPSATAFKVVWTIFSACSAFSIAEVFASWISSKVAVISSKVAACSCVLWERSSLPRAISSVPWRTDSGSRKDILDYLFLLRDHMIETGGEPPQSHRGFARQSVPLESPCADWRKQFSRAIIGLVIRTGDE